MHEIFQWGRGGLDTFRDSHTSSRTRVRLHFDVLHASPHATPPEDFRLSFNARPGPGGVSPAATRDTDIALSGSAAARAPRQRKSRPEWRQTRNHSTDCSINTPKHSGALQKRKAQRISARGVDTFDMRRRHCETSTPKTVAICVRLVTRAPAARVPAARHAA
jgi:hypothetical protein